jgi:hypothetical protein
VIEKMYALYQVAIIHPIQALLFLALSALYAAMLGLLLVIASLPIAFMFDSDVIDVFLRSRVVQVRYNQKLWMRS